MLTAADPCGLITPALVAESTLTSRTESAKIRFTMNDATTLERQVGISYTSSTMEALGSLWSIKVYIGGDQQESSGHVSIYLYWKGGYRQEDVAFLLRVVNQRDPTKSKTRGGTQEKWTPVLAVSKGWHRLIVTNTLFDPTKGFLVDGAVIFEAELYRGMSHLSYRRVDEMQEVPVTLVRDNMALLEVS